MPRAALGCPLEVLRVARKEGTLKPLTSLLFYRSKVLKAALIPINIGRLGLFKSRALLRMSSAFIFLERSSLIILIQNCLFYLGKKITVTLKYFKLGYDVYSKFGQTLLTLVGTSNIRSSSASVYHFYSRRKKEEGSTFSCSLQVHETR